MIVISSIGPKKIGILFLLVVCYVHHHNTRTIQYQPSYSSSNLACPLWG
jgi:hypothetical protein